ncbi:hypothetical protein [Litoribacter populi]|uniref:hypothetical protein n=1 Tax=Litoribacter populi TaxID=2598460 RepID=UPI00117C02A9|nr:hypothetical protein [Litoribacter populi]
MLKRRIINSRDIQLLTGMSIRYCNNLICKMKKYYNKKKHQFITVTEFCDFSGIPEEEVLKVV